MKPLLDISNLTVDVLDDGQASRVLDGLDLQLFPGEIVALLGPSGSGKTTLANLILDISPQGLYKIISGEMTLFLQNQQIDLRSLGKNHPAGNWVSAIFQHPSAALNPVRTVGDQLKEIGSDATAWTETVQLLRELDLDPEEVVSRYPWQLSGGQQQRILLTMALSQSPALLIADEPTASLDRHRQAGFLKLLKKLCTQRPDLAVLFITHDRHLAHLVADRTLRMDQGRLLSSVSSPSPLSLPNKKKDKAEPLHTPPLLEVTDLEAGFDSGKPIITDINLSLLPGQLLGIAGASGSGKSSTLRAILGRLPWQKGAIRINGKLAAPELRRSTCQLVYQDPARSFNPRMSIGQACQEVLRVHRETHPDRVSFLLQMLDLPPDTPDRYPHMFSGGQQQRLAVLRALLASPGVLLCDEPFSALDEDLQEDFLKLMRDMALHQGLGIIVVAHNLPRLIAWCDELLIMDDGRVYWQGPASSIESMDDPLINFLSGEAI